MSLVFGAVRKSGRGLPQSRTLARDSEAPRTGEAFGLRQSSAAFITQPPENLRASSPSPLNGERAGVRGENVRGAPIHRKPPPSKEHRLVPRWSHRNNRKLRPGHFRQSLYIGS